MKKIVFCLLAIGICSCAHKNESERAVASYKADAYAAAAVDSAAAEAVAVEMPLPDGKTTSVANESVEPQIIKTAELEFETDDMDQTYARVMSLIKKTQATVQDDSEGTNDYELFRNMYIRVPSKNFDAFIAEIGNGVSYFERKQISAEDVTEEFVDVQARIKAKKALEERYLQLLQKATKVAEMLEVEQQLSAIREEIEAKEARLNYIKTRVAMSTISLRFHKPLAQQRQATVSYGRKIINAIGTGFNTISYFFIRIIEDWPFWTFVIVLTIWIRRRLKSGKSLWPFGKKRSQKKSETTQE